MHWLNENLAHLHALWERQTEYEQMARQEINGADEGRKKARSDFFLALKKLVSDIVRRQGIIAAFCCHDGLLLECAGDADNFDALAASGQHLLFDGMRTLKNLERGELTQLVLVGDTMTLAYFVVGQVAIGVVAEKGTNLNTSLS